MKYFLFILSSYFIGSIPFGWLYVKIFFKKDVREIGSRNIGATNVYRAAGLIPSLIVFFLDFLKGFLVVFIASEYFPSDYIKILSALFVVLGHNYTIFLNFKGGKGVATTAGVVCILYPKIFIVALLIFLLIFLITKTVSISSLISSFFFTLYILFSEKILFYKLFILFIFLLILFRHRENIKRIIEKRENKIVV